MKESVYKVFVKRADLTSIGLHPTSKEIYDLMHITTCELAIKRWKDEWSFCPVCLARIEFDGAINHRSRKDILV